MKKNRQDIRGLSTMSILLSQDEADDFIRMPKRVIQDSIMWPPQGTKYTYDAVSTDESEKFKVDINHFGRIELRALTFQNRYANDIILVRFDFGHKQHQNPDHSIINGNHVHIYVAGYGISWAYETKDIPLKYLQKSQMFMSDDDFELFDDFLMFCRIQSMNIIPPLI